MPPTHRCADRSRPPAGTPPRPALRRCRRAGRRGDDRAGDLGRSQIIPVVIDLDDDAASGAGKDVGPPDRRREHECRTTPHTGHDRDVGRVRLDQGRDGRQAHGKRRDPAVVHCPREPVPGEHRARREGRVVDPREALDRPAERDVGWTVAVGVHGVGEAGEPDRITGIEPRPVRAVGVPDRRRHDASGAGGSCGTASVCLIASST